MRMILAIVLVAICPMLSLAQDEIYWPEHEGMMGARWSPDGNFIATWGASPMVRIWNDDDGSLALELDIGAVWFALPNGETLDISDGFSLRSFFWSEDKQHVFTYVAIKNVAYPDYFLLVWAAENAKRAYTLYLGPHVVNGKEYWASYRVEGRNYFKRQHQVVREDELAASWYGHTMTFTDIDLHSVSVGKRVATVYLGDAERATDGYWNATGTEFLLPPSAYGYCDDCPDEVKLYDMDLNSNTFGDVLWSRGVFKESHVFAWPNEHDLLAIRILDKLEVWDLDRDSEGFGAKLLDISLEGRAFHAAHYDERHRRLFVGDIEVVEGGSSSETYIPFLCLYAKCMLNISLWDLDLKSSRYGESIKLLRRPYKIYVTSDGGVENHNRMHLNTSSTQLHVYTAVPSEVDSSSNQAFYQIAYDLETLVPVESTDSLPRHAVGPDWFWSGPVYFDFDHGWEVEQFSVGQQAVHHDGNRIILRVRDHFGPNADRRRWFIVDTESRKCFAPPLGWKEYRAGAGC